MIAEIVGIDIYLLDQISKDRFLKGDKLLDAGCGSGRNMRWFIEKGFDIKGCDQNPTLNIESTNWQSQAKFSLATVENMPYDSAEFDAIICSAVLHFANSESHFMEMGQELFRVLKPGGILFIRMTSTFGLAKNYISKGNGRYLLQDGSERFLLTEELLQDLLELGFEKIEPVKSVLVEELRSMTTLVLRKK